MLAERVINRHGMKHKEKEGIHFYIIQDKKGKAVKVPQKESIVDGALAFTIDYQEGVIRPTSDDDGTIFYLSSKSKPKENQADQIMKEMKYQGVRFSGLDFPFSLKRI